MTRALFDTLLDEARAAHASNEALTDFCPFPDDITPRTVTPFDIPPSALLQAETGLYCDRHTALKEAFIAAAPHAHWRETYKDTDIGQDFMDRFGCYCLIGDHGPFHSEKMRAWVVYMPKRLHYPWHHHPGEEMYLVLAGEAEFHRTGEASETLRPGDTVFHGTSQPHATTTGEHPLLAYVVWRNHFETPPVLTPDKVVA